MNLLDIGLIMILIAFFLTGFKNGVIKEVVNFVGIVIVFIASYLLKDFVGKFLCLYAPFFKFSEGLQGISSFNILVYQIIAFLIVFSVLLSVYALVVKASSFIQKLVNLTIILLIPSKILGGLVGILKGYLFLFIALTLLMLPLGNDKLLLESTLTSKILYETPILSKRMEKFTASTKDIYEVARKVTKNEITPKQADIDSLNIMLEYKVVSPSIVRELIEKGKIEVTLDEVNLEM